MASAVRLRTYFRTGRGRKPLGRARFGFFSGACSFERRHGRSSGIFAFVQRRVVAYLAQGVQSHQGVHLAFEDGSALIGGKVRAIQRSLLWGELAEQHGLLASGQLDVHFRFGPTQEIRRHGIFERHGASEGGGGGGGRGVGVRADAYGNGEVLFEHRQGSQPSRKREIHHGPQFHQVVLDGRTGEHQAMARVQRLARQGDLCVWIAHPMSFVQHRVLPRRAMQACARARPVHVAAPASTHLLVRRQHHVRFLFLWVFWVFSHGLDAKVRSAPHAQFALPHVHQRRRTHHQPLLRLLLLLLLRRVDVSLPRVMPRRHLRGLSQSHGVSEDPAARALDVQRVHPSQSRALVRKERVVHPTRHRPTHVQPHRNVVAFHRHRHHLLLRFVVVVVHLHLLLLSSWSSSWVFWLALVLDDCRRGDARRTGTKGRGREGGWKGASEGATERRRGGGKERGGTWTTRAREVVKQKEGRVVAVDRTASRSAVRPPPRETSERRHRLLPCRNARTRTSVRERPFNGRRRPEPPSSAASRASAAST
mmetsp:Transcript_10401/g.63469  ORF Transcript_10401/g.63469 Transcript_10401/m.63469 type:complete len:536 (+) Transcript_10401:1173-2780(+)